MESRSIPIMYSLENRGVKKSRSGRVWGTQLWNARWQDLAGSPQRRMQQQSTELGTRIGPGPPLRSAQQQTRQAERREAVGEVATRLRKLSQEAFQSEDAD